MKLLQLPIAALEQSVKEEIEKNPLLEVESSQPGAESLDSPAVDDSQAEWQEMTGDDDDYDYRLRQEHDPNLRQREPQYTSELSLADQLNDQLGQLYLSPQQLSIAQVIIGSIDDSGYLTRGTDLIANDISFRQGIDVTPDEVEQTLRTVQSLDPPGIGARNLQECLSLQLHRMDMGRGPVRHAASIVDLCFDDFCRNKLDHVADELGLSPSQLQAATDTIRRLNPKPGSAAASGGRDTQVIIPDATVVRQGDNLSYVINDRHLPRLRISPYYAAMMEQADSAPSASPTQRETRRFLHEKSTEANSFIQLLDQRHATLAAIMDFFLAHQRKFFLTGDTNNLRPLKQSQIAEAVGLDVSTVSRVLNSKYIQTEYGTLSMADLCPSAFVTDSGDEVNIDTVRQKMDEIVAAEDPTHPLTDEAIARELSTQGYPLARRTVAKYREMWGILPARLRRRMMAVALPLLLATAAGPVMAQSATTASSPSMSYYDSIIYRRIEDSKRQQAATAKSKAATAATDAKSQNRSQRPPARQQAATTAKGEPKSRPAVDSAALSMPSHLWYGTAFSDHRVKAQEVPLSALPDEVNLRLVADSTGFCFPVQGMKTSPYGWRWERAHRGVDILLQTGDPVSCAFDGVVRLAKPMGGYGNCVVVRHYNGLETVYGHLSKINVKRNQAVNAGDVIGLGGATGRATGPHLHFEVRFQYEPFDPEWILDFQTFGLRTRRLHLDKTYFGISRPVKGQQREYKADQSIIKERRRPTPPPTDTRDQY